MKQSYFLTPKARSDIREILSYSRQNFGRDQADRLRQAFFEQFARLSHFPMSGSTRADLGLNSTIRTRHMQRWLILYRIVTDIEIIRVLDSSRDIQAEMKRFVRERSLRR